MIKITVDNSECTITGLSLELHKLLREALSYTTNTTAHFFSGGYGPKKTSLLSNKGIFPTGLLYIVKALLGTDYVINDIRQVPMPQGDLFKMSLGITPYRDQLEAAEAAQRSKRGIITAPTGVGKSLIISLIIDKLKVPTLIVVPTLELKRQLSNSLAKTFGDDKVGKNKPIYVENIDSCKDTQHKYDCVIIDEFHHSGAKTYRKLNKKSWNKIYYKFGLTATPFRSQDHERLLLESVLSKVVYEVDYTEAVNNGYIVPMEAYYIELPKIKNESNNWAKVYSELVVNNDYRNKQIAKLLNTLNNEDKSTLCLVKEIKHGENLKAITNSWFANGEDEDTPHMITMFNSRKLTTLIGTTGVLGEGVDTRPCEYVIIAGLGKSKNAFMQQVGRGFRKFEGKESCKIILIKDMSHKWTRDHFKAQVKYLLDEYGVIPVKIDIG